MDILYKKWHMSVLFSMLNSRKVFNLLGLNIRKNAILKLYLSGCGAPPAPTSPELHTKPSLTHTTSPTEKAFFNVFAAPMNYDRDCDYYFRITVEYAVLVSGRKFLGQS